MRLWYTLYHCHSYMVYYTVVASTELDAELNLARD